VKNKKLHTIISVYLALAVVFCSTPLSVDAHFCKGIPISISFTGDAINCAELSQSSAGCCEVLSLLESEKQQCPESCCLDLAQIFYINADYQNNATQKIDLQSTLIFAKLNTQAKKTVNHQINLSSLQNHQTPYFSLNKSYQAFIQSFLL